MNGITFIDKDPPEDYKKTFGEDIFSTKTHLYLQSKKGWRSFYIVDHKKKIIQARCHVHIVDNRALSPFRSPHGGIELSHKLDLKALHDFITFIETDLRTKQVWSWGVKLYPQAYDPHNFTRLVNAFLNKGYQVSRSELDAIITIDKSDFKSKLTSWEKRKLNISKKQAFTFFKRDASRFEHLYDFIDECRMERAQSLSMTKHELKNTVSKLRRNFFFFETCDHGKIIAAAITIKVNSRILYNFYSAHSKLYDKFSPAVLMFEGIYEFCRSNNYELLDLGTSAHDEGPNFGLLTFKQNLGGELNLKLSIEKTFI